MSKCKMCPVHLASYVLVVVGALNWGLVGLFNLNLVNTLLGSAPMAEKIVYVLVGLAGLLMLATCKCKKCNEACGQSCCGGEKKM